MARGRITRIFGVVSEPYTIPGHLSLIAAEPESVVITFEKADIPRNIEQYYYYRISHKKVGEKEAAVESYVTVAHVANKKQIELPGLIHNTRYIVYLTLVRQLNNENEDIDVKSLTVETSCKGKCMNNCQCSSLTQLVLENVQCYNIWHQFIKWMSNSYEQRSFAFDFCCYNSVHC